MAVHELFALNMGNQVTMFVVNWYVWLQYKTPAIPRHYVVDILPLAFKQE